MTDKIDPNVGNFADPYADFGVVINPLSKPGDIHDPANVGFLPTGDPRIFEIQSYRQAQSSVVERAGGLSSQVKQFVKPPHQTGRDSPCRYVLPIPSFETADSQPQAIAVGPHNSPTDIKKDGYPFSVNATPLISGDNGPISKAFFDRLAVLVLQNNDFFNTDKDADAIALDIANGFSGLRSGNIEGEISVDDLAAALVSSVTDIDSSTNDQRSVARLIISMTLVDDPRILLMSPNPTRDYRYDEENGNFVPGSNKSNAVNDIPIAAQTPSGFNPEFNSHPVNSDVIDSNDFRMDFQARQKASDQGAVRDSNGGFATDNNPFPFGQESNDILVDVDGNRVPWQGRLVRDHLDDTDQVAANYELVNALSDRVNQLNQEVKYFNEKASEARRVGNTADADAFVVAADAVQNQIDAIMVQIQSLQHDNRALSGDAVDAAQDSYESALSAWELKLAQAKDDPDNQTLQNELELLRQALRLTESDLRLALEEQKQARFNFTKRRDDGDVPDPNPSGVALPLPFMDLNVNKPIPAFTFAALQSEMKSVQNQIVQIFNEAADFIRGLQINLFSGMANYARLKPAFDRQVQFARLQRIASANAFQSFVDAAKFQLGGGINSDGTFTNPLSSPALVDGEGNARYIALEEDDPAQHALDVESIESAFELAYVIAGLNSADVSGTTDVPPTSGDDLTDDEIAENAGISLVPQGAAVLPDSLQSTLNQINIAAGQQGALLDDEFNDYSRATEMAVLGMKDERLSFAMMSWVKSRLIQIPKKLCIFLFGGAVSSINFEGKEINAEFRGILDRISTSKIDRLVQIRMYEQQLQDQYRVARSLSVGLQDAQYKLDGTANLSQDDDLRIAALRYFQSISDQLNLANENIADTQANIVDLQRGEDDDLVVGTSINRLLVSGDDSDGCSLTLQIIDSITTQWADGQNTGFEADKRLYLMSEIVRQDVKEQSINPFYSQHAIVAAVLNRFLNVAIGRYKLIRESLMNSEDVRTSPMVVDQMPGVIGQNTPVDAPIKAIQSLKVVYNRETRDIHWQTGRALGGGSSPSMAYLPTFSLNPDYAFFQTNDIKELFAQGHSWKVVNDYIVPELLAPGSTYSEIEPNPNAFDVTALVTNAPFSVTLILTAPSYLSGEVIGQALHGFHAVMRKFVAVFNSSLAGRGVAGSTNLNTQIAVAFKYGIHDTYRLPRPLSQFERVIGSNQSAVVIGIPAWNTLFQQGYNWGGFGDVYYDVAFKAISKAIAWARIYALNIEAHLDQSVRGKLDAIVESEDDLGNPYDLDPNNQFDFRIKSTVVETPKTGSSYKLDIDIDFADGYANLDIDGFGMVDSFMSGQLRQDVLRFFKQLELSDNWNRLIFGGQPVFRSGVKMNYFMNPVASWDIHERPFTSDNAPHIGFTVSFGWSGDPPFSSEHGALPGIDVLGQYFSKNGQPRSRITRAGGEHVEKLTRQEFDGSFGGQENVEDVAENETEIGEQIESDLGADDSPDEITDVLTDRDHIGLVLERVIHERLYAFLKSVESSANNSFKGTTLLWPTNYGMISQSRLESLLNSDGTSKFPNKIEVLPIGSRQLLVYPINQEAADSVIDHSSFNTSGGPITTEFQKINNGVLVTPSDQIFVPSGAMWVPHGSNFGNGIGLRTFVDQLDQIINVFHAFFGGVARGIWPGQHVLARVVAIGQSTVTVTPISIDGSGAFSGTKAVKVDAIVLGTADDIKVGDEVWLGYDISKYRKPYIWPSVRSSANQINLSAIDTPEWTDQELSSINFLGQNKNGQWDGSELSGNIYSNLLPALVKKVNQLILKNRLNHIETGTFDIVDGIAHIQFKAQFTSAPQVHIAAMVNAGFSSREVYAKPIANEVTKFGATVFFYDSSTGKLLEPCSEAGASGLSGTYAYTAIGPTIETELDLDSLKNIPSGLFEDKASRF